MSKAHYVNELKTNILKACIYFDGSKFWNIKKLKTEKW